MPLVLVAVLVIGILLARTIHRVRWREGTWRAWAQLSIGWSIIVLGLVHIAATWLLYADLTSRALWFASGGIAMALGGALNVLQRLYAGVAPGVSPACIAGNVSLTALAATFVALAGARVAREPQFLLLLGLLLGTTWLSLSTTGVRSAR